MFKMTIKMLCNRKQEICDLVQGFDVKLNYFCRFDDTKLELISKDKQVLANCVQAIYEKFFYYIYADTDKTLSEVLFDILSFRKMTLSVAESLTGGLIASQIVDNAGVSEVFMEGIVAYDNSAKISRLKVSEDTLNMFGAVSGEVATEMLGGLTTTCGISTTGIAGPGGETISKKVGLVYIGIKMKDTVKIYRENFVGDREEIRNKSANYAMFYLLKMALNQTEDRIIR